MTAARNDKADAASYLVSTGVDHSAARHGGWNVYHRPAKWGDVGIDINSRTNKGSTPLMIADFSGNAGAANKGATPLMIAAAVGKTDAASYLVSVGADHSAMSRRGWNVLHFAAHGGNVTTIEKMLFLGIDINSRTIDGETPMMIAARNGKVEAVTYLINKEADPSAVDQSD